MAGDASNKPGDKADKPQISEGSKDSKENKQNSSNQASSTNSSSLNPQVKAALKRAAQALKDSDSAMREGNWEAYGKAQKELSDAIGEAMKEESAK